MFTVNNLKVQYTGLSDEYGTFNVALTVMGQTQSLVTNVRTNLCDESYVTSTYDGVQCPADGQYNFDFDYKLPKLGWYATGWTGTAVRSFCK